MGTFRFKSDLRNHQAIVQPRLYDTLQMPKESCFAFSDSRPTFEYYPSRWKSPLCIAKQRLPKHNGGSLTHWEKTNTQFTNRLIFSTALATPPHSGPPAAYRRRPDPTLCTWFISIDGRHGFRPSSPRLRHRQTGKGHGGVHANSPGKRSSGKKTRKRQPMPPPGLHIFRSSTFSVEQRAPQLPRQAPDRAPARASFARLARRPVPT